MEKNKPTFKIPTLAEVVALPRNGFKFVSTFSGCGGSCLGFRMAGYECVWANEFVPAARDTYRANNPNTPVDGRDIRLVQSEEILRDTGLKQGELDVLEGSPPCASFSTAGSRADGWNKIKKYSDVAQRTDDLFFEYARLVDGIRPRVFVAENVSGLVKGVAKGYFKQILQRLASCGYYVDAALVDAQWLGVPQQRQRIIFIGIRDDLARKYNLSPTFPTPLPYRYSLREAIPWIQGLTLKSKTEAFRGDVREYRDTPVPTITTCGLGPFSSEKCLVEAETDISKYSIGSEWEKLKPGQQSSKYFSLIRPSLDKPCPTITQTAGQTGAAGVCHPIEKRKFSIAELKRLSTFPEDFILTGSFSQQWERIGRSVPPIMMKAIAETIRDRILIKIDSELEEI